MRNDSFVGLYVRSFVDLWFFTTKSNSLDRSMRGLHAIGYHSIGSIIKLTQGFQWSAEFCLHNLYLYLYKGVSQRLGTSSILFSGLTHYQFSGASSELC